MSGFAAVIRFNGAEADCALAKQMTARMAFRGPDGIAHWARGPAALGHCLMRATAQNTSPQPLHHAQSNVTLVMDGYLSNWEDLRRDLEQRGVRFHCGDDAEIVLQAFLTWGDACAARLDGEFSALIWDARNQRAVCLRDHHGLRPLYYHWDGTTLVAASEIAPILEVLPERPPLNLGYIAEFAAAVSYTSDETIWAGVKRLLPAHILEVSRKAFSLQEYWTLPTTVETPFRSDGEYYEAYRAMFAQCVHRAARSHLPAACEVSGGLDSSAVFAMGSHLLKQGTFSAPALEGYTLAGPDGSEADEVEFARAVADHWGTSFREKELFSPPLDWFTQRAGEDCDMPPLPNAAMSMNLDRAAAGDGARIMLTGIGGDQWLDGSYYYYRELIQARDWQRLASQYRADIGAMGLKQATPLLGRFGLASFLPRKMRLAIRDALGAEGAASTPDYPWLSEVYRREIEQRRLAYESQMAVEHRDSYKLRKLKYPRWTYILDQANRQRARSGLEMRSPMMARSFIEFSATTPEHIRLRRDLGKYLHRESLSDLLPDKVTWRESKAEFSTVYFCHDAALEAQVKSADSQSEPMFDTDEVAAFFDQYLATNIDERYTGEIWGIYVSLILMRLDQARRQGETES